MATIQELTTVRDCARAFIDLDAPSDGGPEFDAFVEAATPALQRLLARPDLLTMGFGIGTHNTETRLLYTDGALSIAIAKEPPKKQVSIHDHSMWEMLGLYRGRLEHTLYERADDLSVPGYAELREVSHGVLEVGDVVCVPPAPHDIHGFMAQTDDTYLVAVLPGWYPPVRRYYVPERNAYYLHSKTPV